ncbi:hypothetical protein [Umezawaea sp.]|uniref:hypothetical protein n=1 Tax=Umezawaea sp. TaxID=1955258 RepID=UPI002ED4D66E
MRGHRTEHHGPHAADFADVVGTTSCALAADRIATCAYPRATVPHAYLGRVTDVRCAGPFDGVLRARCRDLALTP